ncbi:multidrug effflux MFS transporter [Corynebacterium sp. H78]|uniref:multidrug effflux MFS transporter n=1 Tax=Corynebacterium sp. H78 TaxID=3133417 RepID=UPI0030ABAC9B
MPRGVCGVIRIRSLGCTLSFGSTGATTPKSDAQQRRIAAVTSLAAAFVIPIVIIAAMPPIGSAAYLPGLPTVTDDFSVSASATQLTLTLYFVGMALGQLFIGPISDNFGRRRPLIIGLITFVVFSVLVALSPSLEVMLLFRLLQGMAASSGAVLGRAIVADIASGARAARVMSVIAAAGMLVPAFAPLFGSGILQFGDWRTIFLVLAAIGAGVGVWTFIVVPETHPKFVKHDELRKTHAGAQKKLPQKPHLGRFVLYAAAVALTFATSYAMISAGPFVFQKVYGLSESQYALTMVVLAGTMAFVGMVGSRYMGVETRFGVVTPERVVTFGLGWASFFAIFVVIAAITQANVFVLLASLIVTTAPLSIALGSATALAMQASPLKHGMSSGLIGAIQSLGGALAPPLVGVLGADPRPMAWTVIGAAGLALLASQLTRFIGRS